MRLAIVCLIAVSFSSLSFVKKKPQNKISFENVEIGVESALREEKMSSTVGVYKTLVGRERGHTHT